MERCARGHCHLLRLRRCLRETVCLPLPLLLLLLLLRFLVDGAAADPGNLLLNGDFQAQPFSFGLYPAQDVLAHGIKTLLPYWTCVYGGVQLLDTRVYVPMAGDPAASFVVHMNSPQQGPGHVVSMPMYAPRKGATYTVSLSVADNPNGGPSHKALMLALLDGAAGGAELQPPLEPIIVANMSASRRALVWQRVVRKMRGTGTPVLVYLGSLVPGPYGVLIANVQVNLDSLVDNGSFEALTPGLVFDNETDSAALAAPSSVAIPNWNLESGIIRVCLTGPQRLQASTDGSATLLDLNANNSAAVISTTFAGRAGGAKYTLLFDTAADPSTPQTVVGQLLVRLEAQPSGKTLVAQNFDVDSTGFSPDSVGWETKTITFETGKDDAGVKLTFSSKITGSYGSFLDNVQVYEVVDEQLPPAVNGTTASRAPERPAVVRPPWALAAVTALLLIFFPS